MNEHNVFFGEMMKKLKNIGLIAVTTLSALSVDSYAANLTFGDANTDAGQLTVSGWLRAKYSQQSGSTTDGKLNFEAAKLALDYDSNKFTGQFETRCYQWSKLCDFVSLVNANVGYKITPKANVTAGLMNAPFGPGRGWSSFWYGGVATQVGLEDSHQLGVKYQQTFDSKTKVDIGFFPTSGGHYKGTSTNSLARYSSDVVTDASSGYTDAVKEKNMVIATVDQTLPNFGVTDLSLSGGVSYWYGQIENKTVNKTGSHQAAALYGRATYKGVNVTLTGGHNKIDNKSVLYPDSTLYGSFDTPYAVANNGNFYTADVNYSFKNIFNVKDLNVMPYASYSSYAKTKAGWSDSTRYAFGAQLDYKAFSVATEYITAKNDPFIGGSTDSLAAGDGNGINHLWNVQLFYNF